MKYIAIISVTLMLSGCLQAAGLALVVAGTAVQDFDKKLNK